MSSRSPLLVVGTLLCVCALGLSTDARSDAKAQRATTADPRDATTRLFHTGLGIGARIARVSMPTTVIVTVSEGALVLGDTVEAGVEAGGEVMQARLLVIANSREAINELRKRKGTLRREDPDYARIVAGLIRDTTELQGMDVGDYFTWALSSREAKVRMRRVPFEHYATAFLGKWIARGFGVGPRIASTFRDPLHVRRDMSRAAWKQSDGFARMMGKSLEELYRRLATVDLRILARPLGQEKKPPTAQAEGTFRAPPANTGVTVLPFEPPLLGVPLVTPPLLPAPVGAWPGPPLVTPPLAPLVPQEPPIAPLPPLPPLVPLPDAPTTAPAPEPMPPEAPPAPDEPPPPSGSSRFRPGDSPSLRQLDRINRTGNW